MNAYVAEKPIVYEGRFIRTDREFDMEAFARDLAKALGCEIEVKEPGRYAMCTILAEGGLKLFLRSENGAKMGKVSISAGTDATRILAGDYRPVKFPSGTFDAGRDMASLAKDVRRRVIEASAEALAEVGKRVAEKKEAISGIEAVMADYAKKFPSLRIVREGNATSGAVSFYKDGKGSLDGTLYADGRVSFQRVSAYTPEASEAVLAAIMGRVK